MCFFIDELKIRKELKELIVNSIIGNCDITLAIDEETLKYVPEGNILEVAMINFLIENEIDVPEKIITRNRTAKKLSSIPFDQNKKLMVYVRSDPHDST